MSHSITIDNLDQTTLNHLKDEATRRGVELQVAARDALRRGVLPVGSPAFDTLDPNITRLAGTWTDADVAEFNEATKQFSQIDEEHWK